MERKILLLAEHHPVVANTIGVLADRNLDGMNVAQGSFLLNTTDPGPVSDGFVRNQAEPPARLLC